MESTAIAIVVKKNLKILLILNNSIISVVFDNADLSGLLYWIDGWIYELIYVLLDTSGGFSVLKDI